jgi:hypothetical protein
MVYLTSFEEDNYAVNKQRGDLRSADGHLLGSSHTENRRGAVQQNEPSINNTNSINTKRIKHAKETGSNFEQVASDEKDIAEDRNRFRTGGRMPDSLESVKGYFEMKQSTAIEAEKFFNHFQSNGWKVGGRSPMMDWHAAARNWILNAAKFDKAKNSQLHTTTDKNYGEPL